MWSRGLEVHNQAMHVKESHAVTESHIWAVLYGSKVTIAYQPVLPCQIRQFQF